MGKGVSYRIRRKGQVIALKFTSPEFVSKLYFKHLLGYSLNLAEPKTFNEKLQWYKLYYCPNSKSIIQCADKYAVRFYMEMKGYGEYLNDIIDVWDKAEDIDWNVLPEQFAMKCTHGCAYNIICDAKSEIDIPRAQKQIKTWMKEDFGLFNAEPHYSKMKPRVICEKYLGGDILDYKFFCFHGEPQFMYIAQGFGKGINERITFFDMDGHIAPYKRGDYPILETATAPERFEKMVRMSRDLSKDFPFVRVDWFEVNGRIYFSELTFTPCGGLMKIEPEEYDAIWGDMFDIESLRIKTL